jgi:hypothetical protein
MGSIRQCVKDVLHIANESEDFEQAKRRIQQLFVEGRRREHLAVAQRVRDQLSRTYGDSAPTPESAWIEYSIGLTANT